ncbi:MAG TPA: AMP-binding protein [Burkholderiales bacterium]
MSARDSMFAQPITYFDERVERMAQPQLLQLQLALLRERLQYVHERSPFYRRKLDAAGIRADEVRTLDDVRRIPFTDKEELRASQAANPPWGDFACISPREAIRVFQTSGTTGKPVRMMVSRTDWFENYYRQFSHFRCGYGLTEDDVLFVPFNYGLYLAWWGFQSAMEKAGLMVIPGGGLSSKDRLRAMLDWGATAVCGTPTYLLYLAETARKHGVDLPASPIRKVIAAGEPGAAIPSTKKAIQSQWGAECFDDIGSTEISNFGFECLAHEGTHVVEGMFLAEAVNPETLAPVADGQVGELILTNLCCESVPLIRYRTRDLVRFNRAPCACGRTSLRLDGGVLGRSDDMFHFAGVNVFPSQVQDLLHQVDEFSQEYQLVVPPLGSGRHLRIRVEPAREGIAASAIAAARDCLIETIRYRITITPEVEVCEIGSLPRVEGKAKRLVRES